MTKSPNKTRNTDGLKKFSEKKNQETILKVNNAIDRLKRSKTKKINFKTVAEESGVSKATLYNNPILKERILSLRALSKVESEKDTSNNVKTSVRSKEQRIKRLYEENLQLKKDKDNLILQLIEMEDLKDENNRLKERLSKLTKLN
ncbi:DUF6262 family protein [Turicibacter sanguinis]|uniref:DUF6262 family protein n=1 Tax=Turicibacter sanguinis TaxID=154288 RepID=UPI00189DFB2D|nr:DUF6262 family protein [Turicibacter sanguinis]